MTIQPLKFPTRLLAFKGHNQWVTVGHPERWPGKIDMPAIPSAIETPPPPNAWPAKRDGEHCGEKTTATEHEQNSY